MISKITCLKWDPGVKREQGIRYQCQYNTTKRYRGWKAKKKCWWELFSTLSTPRINLPKTWPKRARWWHGKKKKKSLLKSGTKAIILTANLASQIVTSRNHQFARSTSICSMWSIRVKSSLLGNFQLAHASQSIRFKTWKARISTKEIKSQALGKQPANLSRQTMLKALIKRGI